MVLLLALMTVLALDLSSVREEPKLEKRSELALEYAEGAIDTARDAYQQGHFEQAQAALSEVREAVELSYESLVATGKNPRKDSKHFKNAEKATRQILRRLQGLRDVMSAVDHHILDPVAEEITRKHDSLVSGILTGEL
jgi:type II secretory pathway pseudopilin PulG